MEKRATIEFHPSDAAGKGLAAPDVAGQTLFETTSQLPVLSMFKSAAEVLLAHESLDEMLQQVVNLIAEYLPGRRARSAWSIRPPARFSRAASAKSRRAKLFPEARSPYSRTGSHF